jgi:hypothetical protein
VILAFAAPFPALQGAEPELSGRWLLPGNAEESEGQRPASLRDVKLNVAGPGKSLAGGFNGRSSQIEIADAASLRLGTGEFTIALWVSSETQGHESPGDLLSQYDPRTRTGFHLGLYSHGGVTNSQPNLRQLHFGIDQGRIEESFTDHGRLGQAVFVFAQCVHDGRLYAATCEQGENEAGHVYRFAGGDRWTDLGCPDKANSISAMASFDGKLYVASSKYRLAGSSLTESANPHFGGKVFRLGAKDEWIPCGTLSPDTEAVASLIGFRGKLFASSLYKPAGFFRYEGGERWTALPTPDGKRVEAMTIFNDALYATCYDEGSIFRFDGERWEDLGKLPGATQTYGFGIHRGELFVSEWPQAHVFRWVEAKREWIDTGKLGMELEAMPLLVYNGGLYCGSLPSAEVFRFDGPEKWFKIGRVDQTPDVKYRRAWSMAVFQGRLFVGTLPSGRVLSIEAGRNATLDRALPAGWHHVAAVRGAQRLRLFVDGTAVAESAPFEPGDYDLSNHQPLRIGAGAQDFFDGSLSDVRLYRGALSNEQIKALAKSPAGQDP